MFLKVFFFFGGVVKNQDCVVKSFSDQTILLWFRLKHEQMTKVTKKTEISFRNGEKTLQEKKKNNIFSFPHNVFQTPLS